MLKMKLMLTQLSTKLELKLKLKLKLSLAKRIDKLGILHMYLNIRVIIISYCCRLWII